MTWCSSPFVIIAIRAERRNISQIAVAAKDWIVLGGETLNSFFISFTHHLPPPVALGNHNFPREDKFVFWLFASSVLDARWWWRWCCCCLMLLMMRSICPSHFAILSAEAYTQSLVHQSICTLHWTAAEKVGKNVYFVRLPKRGRWRCGCLRDKKVINCIKINSKILMWYYISKKPNEK